ncbi:type II secretion system F family protein [bacterium]|nr:type II secretion system F family protein [bacterium]
MDTSLLLSYFAAFSAAALLIVGINMLWISFAEHNQRLWMLAQRENEGRMDAAVASLKQLLVTAALKYHFVEKIFANIKRDIVRANYPETAREYLASSLFQGLIVLIIGAAICLTLFGFLSLLLPVLLALLWALWMRPSMVGADGEKRSRGVYRRIPYALDLSVLVLQTGGTLGEALEVVSEHDDPLAQELRTALQEMDSGASQSAALRNMSDRIGLEPLDSIVTAINRGSETGAPMAQTLTTQAELFRERRLQEVEKLAVEAPTKMTFPNMMVMLSVLLIVVGPTLKKMTGSGLF